MTNQNNAAQAAMQSVLTEEDRRQLLVRANYPRIQEDPRAYLVKITEELVLSKLRAEGVQAGDERESFSDWAWRKDGLAIGHMDGQAAAWEAWQERARRAALASARVAGRPLAYSTPQSKGPDVWQQVSAPVAGKCPPPPPPPPSLAYREIESGVVKPRPEPFMHHDDYPHNPRMFQPTPAQASAPVAGEPAEWQSAQRITELPAVDTALANFCDDGTQNNAVLLVLAILYAAPRASEAATAAAHDVLAERRRQVDAEGFQVADDDRYQEGQMSAAAAAYTIDACANVTGHASLSKPPSVWPWDPKWWKPDGARRNLVKAAALILAEIERLDRAAIAQQKGEA